MPDREKVTRDLAHIAVWVRSRADMATPGSDAAMLLYSWEKSCEDALALLKEQEARVMTWQEVDKSGSTHMWVEIHSPHVNQIILVYCTVKQSEGFPDSFILNEDSGVTWLREGFDYNRDGFFGIHSGWRCWTARPTEEQRRTVKWDA